MRQGGKSRMLRFLALTSLQNPLPVGLTHVTSFLLASDALVEALFDDPFYWALTDDFGNDLAARKQALRLYFTYSLQEAERTGRCVVAGDLKLGAAAWLLPRTAQVETVESGAKSEYLASILGPKGYESYNRIVQYMAPRAAQVVPEAAWYLSIIGVAPAAQGRGLGAALLAETLAEASRVQAPCYLETFTPRSVRFYERLGFRSVGEHVEPTTGKAYVVMLREPSHRA
jgi:GNAT superfamily N-acetyltransferase